MKTVIIRIGSEAEKWLQRTAISVSMAESVRIACFAKALFNLRIVWICILANKILNHMSALIVMSAMQSFILKTVPIVVSAIFVLRALDARIASDV